MNQRILFGALLGLTIFVVLLFATSKKSGPKEHFETVATVDAEKKKEEEDLISLYTKEQVEDLVNQNMPVYLSTFDRETVRNFQNRGTPYVWPNLGYKKAETEFKMQKTPAVHPFSGLKITEPLVGPDSEKLLSPLMNRKLTACTLAWVLRTDMKFDQENVRRITLFECGANVTGNIGIRVSFLGGETDENFTTLEVRWAQKISKFRMPLLPLQFGDSLLVVTNDNARIRVYLYSLSLDSFMKVEEVVLGTTAGVSLPLSNTPCSLFTNYKGAGDHKLRMFLMSYAAFTQTEIELLAKRYLDLVNVRMLKYKKDLLEKEELTEAQKEELETRLDGLQKRIEKSKIGDLPGVLDEDYYRIRVLKKSQQAPLKGQTAGDSKK